MTQPPLYSPRETNPYIWQAYPHESAVSSGGRGGHSGKIRSTSKARALDAKTIRRPVDVVLLGALRLEAVRTLP